MQVIFLKNAGLNSSMVFAKRVNEITFKKIKQWETSCIS